MNPILTPPDELQREKKKQAALTSALGTKEPGSPVAMPDTGIAAKPKTIDIGGIPHLDLPDQKYPGPLSMAASAAAGTIGHVATAPFGNRAEERLAANRAELNNETAEPQAKTKPAPSTSGITGGVQAVANQGVSDLAGRQAGHMIDNNLRSFEDKGNSTVRQVGANGKIEFTNVGTENVTDPSKKVQVNGYDGAADNEAMAKANAIRQQIIDRQPQGGVGILGDGGIEAANAEKTARWREDDLIAKARSNPAAGQLANTIAQGGNQQAIEALRQQGIASGNQVQMRGQDLTAQTEANRQAIESPLKRAQTEGIAAQTMSAQMIAELQQKAVNGDQQAVATLRALNGKNQSASDRYLTVQGGEEIGPDGMTKIKKPGGVFDAQTQSFIPMNGGQSGQQQAPSSAIDYLKKNPNQAAAFKAKYGYLPEGF